MASPTDLQDLCEAVLSAATAALDALPGYGAGLEGAPSRAYITDGQPALSCPQLSVNVGPRISQGATAPLGLGAGTRHRTDGWINHVGIQVWLTRCRPQDIPPDPDAMNAFTEQFNADGWGLWNYFCNINRPGSTDPIVTLCDEWFMDSLAPLQPSGLLSGWLLNARAELHGYGDGANPGGP